VTPQRGRVIALCDLWDDRRFTLEDGPDVTVKAVPLGAGTRAHDAMRRALDDAGGRFAAVCMLRPTGWAFSARQAKESEGPRPWCQHEGRTRLYEVPYSEHSSFLELRAFIRAIRPRAIIPTVNAEDADHRAAMAELFADHMDHSQNKSRIDSYLRQNGPPHSPLSPSADSPTPDALSSPPLSKTPTAAAVPEEERSPGPRASPILVDDSDDPNEDVSLPHNPHRPPPAAHADPADETSAVLAGVDVEEQRRLWAAATRSLPSSLDVPPTKRQCPIWRFLRRHPPDTD